MKLQAELNTLSRYHSASHGESGGPRIEHRYRLLGSNLLLPWAFVVLVLAMAAMNRQAMFNVLPYLPSALSYGSLLLMPAAILGTFVLLLLDTLGEYY